MGTLLRGWGFLRQQLSFARQQWFAWAFFALGAIIPYVVKSILIVLGVGLVTLTVFQPIIDQAESFITSNIQAAGYLVPYLGLLRIDQFISVVFSAVTVRGAVGAVKVVRSARARSLLEA